jgi:hypothetical protein
MMMTPRRFFLICLATTAFATPSLAGETPAVVDVLLKNIERQTQVKPTFESAEEDDSGNVTVTKLSFVPKTAKDGEFSLTIGEITMEDVSDEDNGLFAVGSATFKDMKVEGKGADGKGFVVEMPEGSAEEWYIKDAGDNPTPADALRSSMTLAKTMTSGAIKLTTEGQTITSDGYQSTWDGDPATGAGTFTSKLGNVVIPASVIALMDPSNTLKNLGYSDLSIDISGGGKYTVDAENMGIDMNFAVAGKDMGAFKFALSAHNVPIAAYAEMQKAQATGKQPDFTALMPQLQSVTFDGMSLRFEDASITKKLLPMVAAMSGMGDEAAFVTNAGAMVQVSLMQLNNPDFTTKVVGAVNAFLKDPKSITVALKPAAPVSVQQLMTLNPADPGAAIKTLGINVTAND